jgi:DNA topoisomerase-1
MKIIQVKYISLASNDEWWESLTKEQKDKYIEEHPNSKYAKNRQDKKEMVKKKIEKLKKNPYEDMPEHDRQKVETLKKRGYRIPPGWRDIWVNPDPDGDCQAKGISSTTGRKVYIYTAKFSQMQSVIKFNRISNFTRELPELKKKIDQDFDSKPEAQVCYLMLLSGFRAGGEGDGKSKVKAYGAATLLDEHVKVKGDECHFDFIGKEGIRQQHVIKDKKLANLLKDKKGRLFDTDDSKVLKYVKTLSDSNFKQHDFRTYVGTSTAVLECSKRKQPKDRQEYEDLVDEVCEIVAKKLGNTPKMSRENYIDPTVFKAWESDIDMTKPFKRKPKPKVKKEQSSTKEKSLDELMQEFIEDNMYQLPSELIIQYKKVQKLKNGSKERAQAYILFQKIAKKYKVVNSLKSKEEYIKSLKILELALATYKHSVKNKIVASSFLNDQEILKSITSLWIGAVDEEDILKYLVKTYPKKIKNLDVARKILNDFKRSKGR